MTDLRVHWDNPVVTPEQAQAVCTVIRDSIVQQCGSVDGAVRLYRANAENPEPHSSWNMISRIAEVEGLRDISPTARRSAKLRVEVTA